MRNPWWITAVGVIAFSAFFWAVGGAVDLGLEQHARGRYGLPREGQRYTYALFGGGVIALGSMLALAGRRVPGWQTALLPVTGLVVGAASVLILGQQSRHWLAAGAMTLAGLVIILIAARRRLADRPSGNERASR
ncbi:hypothetical protein [Streptomyces sp. NPDC126499]|uniref:hypothetical protein n=1 Tax=Streptomyces sp. NPDC126499 TaxID=3155314 RepID=UPI00332312DA